MNKLRLSILVIILLSPIIVFGQMGKSALDHAFVGGTNTFRMMLTKTLDYPRSARQAGTVGISIFSFGINCETELPFDFQFETVMGDGIEEAIIKAVQNTKGSWLACSENNERIRIKLSFTINNEGPVAKDALAVINAMDFSNQALADGTLINRATKAMDKKKFQKAEKYIQQLIARYPDNREYRQMLENLRNN